MADPAQQESRKTQPDPYPDAAGDRRRAALRESLEQEKQVRIATTKKSAAEEAAKAMEDVAKKVEDAAAAYDAAYRVAKALPSEFDQGARDQMLEYVKDLGDAAKRIESRVTQIRTRLAEARTADEGADADVPKCQPAATPPPGKGGGGGAGAGGEDKGASQAVYEREAEYAAVTATLNTARSIFDRRVNRATKAKDLFTKLRQRGLDAIGKVSDEDKRDELALPFFDFEYVYQTVQRQEPADPAYARDKPEQVRNWLRSAGEELVCHHQRLADAKVALDTAKAELDRAKKFRDQQSKLDDTLIAAELKEIDRDADERNGGGGAEPDPTTSTVAQPGTAKPRSAPVGGRTVGPPTTTLQAAPASTAPPGPTA